MAQDRKSRRVVALHLGDRGAAGARGLWESMPEHFRRQAIFFTDAWEAYKKVIPAARHVPPPKRKTPTIPGGSSAHSDRDAQGWGERRSLSLTLKSWTGT